MSSFNYKLNLNEDEIEILEGLKVKCLSNLNKKIELNKEEISLLKRRYFLFLALQSYLRLRLGDDVILVRDRNNGLYVGRQDKGSEPR